VNAPILVLSGVAPFLEAGLAFALALSAWRLFRGPTIADRAIALEVASATVLGYLLLAGAADEEPSFVDVALVVALVSFVTTLAFARYLSWRNPRG
jgi:multicomponent Na+:H+ antiporter subunit F